MVREEDEEYVIEEQADEYDDGGFQIRDLTKRGEEHAQGDGDGVVREPVPREEPCQNDGGAQRGEKRGLRDAERRQREAGGSQSAQDEASGRGEGEVERDEAGNAGKEGENEGDGMEEEEEQGERHGRDDGDGERGGGAEEGGLVLDGLAQ